eukprot:TRINITY_DN4691_c0_g1_i16.p1 TRINITY_DN4691_c0_g1~~TRINITY_DN4691_c0_g1_i16.p1  ORF type:complete len:467 (+),score=42.17 TRINITY_DN4691_c0_g1_i16:78-1478(+)
MTRITKFRTFANRYCQLVFAVRLCFVVFMVLVTVIWPCLVWECGAVDNGVALTPPMGYNTWNSFGCHINETVVKANIDLMIGLGLRQAGYEYFILDDCWQANERVKTGPDKGKLTWNETKFPSGIPSLVDYAHSKGLKFGIYSDAGLYSCQHYPGSFQHEELDAATFASWGVDYLKYDNCYEPPNVWVVDRYKSMSLALKNTGRAMVFAICEWGAEEPYTWAPSIGNTWRTTQDIHVDWQYIMRALDGTIGLSEYAGPGAWNDPDMLEVGNIPTTKYPVSANRAHFVVWAIMKAPLIIGADLRKLEKIYLDILKMKEVIAVNQDLLGVAGDLVKKQGYQEVYAAPLFDGSRAVVFLNRNEVSPGRNISISWKRIGYPSSIYANIRDLCKEKDLGVFTGSIRVYVDALDAVMVKVSPLEQQPEHVTWRPWFSGFYGEKEPPSQPQPDWLCNRTVTKTRPKTSECSVQ